VLVIGHFDFDVGPKPSKSEDLVSMHIEFSEPTNFNICVARVQLRGYNQDIDRRSGDTDVARPRQGRHPDMILNRFLLRSPAPRAHVGDGRAQSRASRRRRSDRTRTRSGLGRVFGVPICA